MAEPASKSMAGIRYVPLPLKWRSFSVNDLGMHRAQENEMLRRMGRILNDWEGTPYADGQSVKGVGTFCTAFVCAVLDELYRKERPTPMPEIPSDAAMHDRATAIAGLHWFLRHYPENERQDGDLVQPGDILITGPVGGGPGHAMFVGPRENTLWQCSGESVHYTGMHLPDVYRLFAVYRMKDRHTWL